MATIAYNASEHNAMGGDSLTEDLNIYYNVSSALALCRAENSIYGVEA